MKMSTRLITAFGISAALSVSVVAAPAAATATVAVGTATAATTRSSAGHGAADPGAVAAPSRATAAAVTRDATAQTYYAALLRHTRWAETQYDPKAGIYKAADQNFAVVLGNAVLLTRGDYDAKAAGIDKATLQQHTLATITHYAASNRLAGGTEWGKTLFWDSTFESYFTLAAHLLWTDLDQTTRDNVNAITAGQAAYNTGLGTADDPASGTWTPNGLTGGFEGDTKLEEMGVYTQGIAPGLAWNSTDAAASTWNTAFGTWARNESSLPAADKANPTKVDGVPISNNTAHNLHDTFIVENHGSFEPHYQEELWRTSGRNSIQFLMAGKPLPQVMTEQPNGDDLWKTILSDMSDAGEPLMPMLNDREHLYGRDVIPLAFLSQVQGDRYAATAEDALAKRLPAYQAYAPSDQLTKFSGEAKYEPEARAELAISYLLHEWRDSTGHPVKAAAPSELYAAAAGATDHGNDVGLVDQQSENAWAGAVSKPGFTKFAWQPEHDDWLFDLSNTTPEFLPSTSQTVSNRYAATYSQLRDGFDGSANLFTTGSGYAGMTTLPTGTVVYATSGTAAGEGRITVDNLTMPGVPGLDGDRSYTSAEGTKTFKAADTTPATPPPAGVTRVDNLTFPATTATQVRMVGVTGQPTYGYSLFELEAGSGTGNAALGKTATATSADPAYPASNVTDGKYTTRWAVSKAERTRGDSSVTVDLGAPTQLDHVDLYWESAVGSAYRVQTSTDGKTWTDVASYGLDGVDSHGNWLSIDGRAGLVVRGSTNPITVRADQVVLSDGPASGSAGMVVEGYAGADARATKQLAARPAVTTSQKALVASDADGYLSLFNLSGAAVAGTVQVPGQGSSVNLYPGSQTTGAHGLAYAASVAAAGSAVEPSRFQVSNRHGGPLPSGVAFTVTDAQHLTVTAPRGGRPLQLTVAQTGTHDKVEVTVPAGKTKQVAMRSGKAYPIADLALGRTTFPTSPLPAGMSDPALAVDGHPSTVWTPGSTAASSSRHGESASGRMVVDLGAARAVGSVALQWAGGAPRNARVSVSSDGVTYTPVTKSVRHGGGSPEVAVDAVTRYVAVTVAGASRHSGLATLTVRPQ